MEQSQSDLLLEMIELTDMSDTDRGPKQLVSHLITLEKGVTTEEVEEIELENKGESLRESNAMSRKF